MRWFGLAAALAVAGIVGTQFGWKWVLAPLLGYAFIRWSIGSLRAMTADGRATAHLDAPQPRPVRRSERVLYWCEDCGTELLLVVRGTGKPPRHCATAMHEREELVDGPTTSTSEPRLLADD
ncbi:MAG TPA: hypothetical protein VJ978_13775 [Nitriliruptoraceae bacterium]|nr:hypothetical protein [Nitriliruptoraceae bacterium]